MLEPLTPADIPEVMRLERRPGYEDVVGRWEADQHASEMASPLACYFGLRDGAGLLGFVMLQELDQPVVLLRRIAVGDAGQGTGGMLLRDVMDWVFSQTSADGLRLDVLPHNARARRAYAREGFADYGDAVIHGQPHILMSVSRERWEELRG